MSANRDFIVVNIPAPSFEELSNIEKGDVGEKLLELCLIGLCLEPGRDFISYLRTGTWEKKTVPDFSDEVGGRQKTFDIEVKNLSLNSDVYPGWIKQNVPPYWLKICDFQKVLIIFGGNIDQNVPVMLRKEAIHYIHYEKPVATKDDFDLVWWLKDELLEVSNIRKRTIIAINRQWRSSPLASVIPLNLLHQDKLFLTLNYDTSKSCFILRSFPKREWKSQQEIYEAARFGVDGMHEWIEKSEDIPFDSPRPKIYRLYFKI